MQGNERNRNEIDEQFVSQAWDSMKLMLDQELPVTAMDNSGRQEGKRYLLLLLLLLIGFGAGAGWMYWIYQTPDVPQTPEPQALVELNKMAIGDPPPEIEGTQNQANPAKSDPLTLESIATENTDETPKATPIISSRPRANRSAAKAPAKWLAKADVNAGTSAGKGIDQKSAEIIVTKETAISSPINPTSPEKQLLPSANALVENNKALDVAPLENTIALLAEAERKIKPLHSIQKDSKWQWSVGASAIRDNQSAKIGSSFALESLVSRKLSNRFFLQTGVAWNHLEKNQPLDGIDKTPQIAPLNQFNEGLFDFALRSGYLPALNYIKVPLQMSYQINKSMKVNAGAHVAYLLKGIGKKSDSQGLEPGTPEHWESILQDKYNSYDFGFQFGLSYYPVDRLGILLQYNAGFGDFTNNEDFGFEEVHSNQYLQLGLTYQIKK